VKNVIARQVDRVITSAPHIRERFLWAGFRAVDIINYPMIGELAAENGKGADFSAGAHPHVCYGGGVARVTQSRDGCSRGPCGCEVSVGWFHLSPGEGGAVGDERMSAS